MPALNTFDRHLLREWLSFMALVLVLMCGLLLVQVMYNDFRDLRDAGAHFGDLVLYVAIAIPSFLALTLPIVLLVATLYTLGKLHKANELTAMRAAGVGFGRLMAPIWVVGVLCCALMWWLNGSIVPWSVERTRVVMESFQFKKQAARSAPVENIGAVFSVGFDNPDGRRMWFFNRYSKFTGKAYGVFVTELDVKRREVSRIVAEEAWYDPKKQGWEFKNGRDLAFSSDGENVSSEPFADRFYPRFREDPQLMMLMDRRPIDLSITELHQLIDYFSTENNPKGLPYAVRYYGLLADFMVPLIVIAIAIPFSVSGVRVNPAVGVSKSIGLFLLYYTLLRAAEFLATRQVLDPQLAAWLPNLGMTGVAVVLFHRLR